MVCITIGGLAFLEAQCLHCLAQSPRVILWGGPRAQLHFAARGTHPCSEGVGSFYVGRIEYSCPWHIHVAKWSQQNSRNNEDLLSIEGKTVILMT